jgi:hypothetical protein
VEGSLVKFPSPDGGEKNSIASNKDENMSGTQVTLREPQESIARDVGRT